jgi:hypothetical protein
MVAIGKVKRIDDHLMLLQNRYALDVDLTLSSKIFLVSEQGLRSKQSILESVVAHHVLLQVQVWDFADHKLRDHSMTLVNLRKGEVLHHLNLAVLISRDFWVWVVAGNHAHVM